MYVIENGNVTELSSYQAGVYKAPDKYLIEELKKRGTYPISDTALFISEIIESFEAFLEDRNIILNNPEKDDEDNDPDEVANIYGSDYGEPQTTIEAILRQRGLIAEN